LPFSMVLGMSTKATDTNWYRLVLFLFLFSFPAEAARDLPTLDDLFPVLGGSACEQVLGSGRALEHLRGDYFEILNHKHESGQVDMATTIRFLHLLHSNLIAEGVEVTALSNSLVMRFEPRQTGHPLNQAAYQLAPFGYRIEIDFLDALKESYLGRVDPENRRAVLDPILFLSNETLVEVARHEFQHVLGDLANLYQSKQLHLRGMLEAEGNLSLTGVAGRYDDQLSLDEIPAHLVSIDSQIRRGLILMEELEGLDDGFDRFPIERRLQKLNTRFIETIEILGLLSNAISDHMDVISSAVRGLQRVSPFRLSAFASANELSISFEDKEIIFSPEENSNLYSFTVISGPLRYTSARLHLQADQVRQLFPSRPQQASVRAINLGLRLVSQELEPMLSVLPEVGANVELLEGFAHELSLESPEYPTRIEALMRLVGFD